MNKNKKALKKISIIVLSAFIFLSALLGILYLVSVLLEEKVDPIPTDPSIFFFQPDYEENIFDNILYMNKNRGVFYMENGLGFTYDEENYTTADTYGRFFYDYFQTVINGRYEEYKDYFSDYFLKNYNIPEKFTMQKIYDISIEFFSFSKRTIEGVEVGVRTYTVNYKIMENNGTFRQDVGSNQTKTIVFDIIEIDGSIYINAIMEMLNEYN